LSDEAGLGKVELVEFVDLERPQQQIAVYDLDTL
jgi:hypothetical protein